MIYATTAEFLNHFGLNSRRDLPGIDELRAAGLLDPVDDAYAALMGDSGEAEASAGAEADEADEDADLPETVALDKPEELG